MLILTDLILTSGTGVRSIVIAVSLELGTRYKVASLDGSRLSLLRVGIKNCEYRGLLFISTYEPPIYGLGA